MHSSVLLLIPLFGFALAAEQTNVSVKYLLSCPNQASFNYNIKIYEEDVLFDDYISEGHGIGKGTAEGIITGFDNGDFPTNSYEFYAWVEHNCGAEGKTTRIELNPLCTVGTPACDYDIKARL